MRASLLALLCLLPAGAQDPDNKPLTPAEILHESGGKKFDADDLEGAIADYTKSIEADPKSAITLRSRATAYGLTGRNKESIADYDKAFALEPPTPTMYAARGRSCYDAGAWEDALRDFRRACVTLPMEREFPWLYLWLIRARLGERDAATAELNDYVTKREPKKPDDFFLRIVKLYSGRMSQADFFASNVSKDAVRTQALKCEGLFYAGALHLMNGDEAGARDLFTQCCGMKLVKFASTASSRAELARLDRWANPTARAIFERGREREAGRDLAGALAEYSRALERDPSFAEAWSARGALRFLTEDRDGAIADHLKAIELALWVEVARKRDRSSNETRSWKDAMTDFRRACRLEPAPRVVRQLFGGWLAQARAGKPDQAGRELREAATDGSRDGRAPWFQALCTFLGGRGDEAGLLKAAGADADRAAVRTRESRFWIAMKAAIGGDMKTAMRQMESCLDEARPDDGPLALVKDASGVDVLVDRSAAAVTIKEAPNPPAAPANMTPIGKAYEIAAPSVKLSNPAIVRLPLPDPAIAQDRTKALFVGHYDGKDWEILPARIVDGKAVAQIAHFSLMELLTLPFRRTDPPVEELRRARTHGPNLRGLLVEGDRAWAELDLYLCAHARIEGNLDPTRVNRLRVYVSRPKKGDLEAKDEESAFEPYRIEKSDITLDPDDKHPRMPLTFDPDAVMAVGSETTVTAGAWYARVAPIFADGTEGRLCAESTRIPVAAAEAHLKLRKGLAARMTPDQGAQFERMTERNPYYIVFNYRRQDDTGQATLMTACYSSRLIAEAAKLRDAAWLGTDGFGYAYIALVGDSPYWHTICHEWGHYVYNIMIGEESFSQMPGGRHMTWTESQVNGVNSRSLAWSEDLASYLGQYGTLRGLPGRAGSMRGNWEDHSRKCAWAGAEASCWPRNRRMDATCVEAIPATILSRATKKFEFPGVYDMLHTLKPMEITEFFDTWTGVHPSRPEVGAIQQIYLDEGVAWKVKGRVVGRTDKDKEPQPLKGARVRPQTPTGEFLGAETADTDADGRFELAIPPGTVQFDVQIKKWKPAAPLRFACNTGDSTLGEAQPMPDFLMKPADEARLLFVTPDRAPSSSTINAAALDGSNVEKIGALPPNVTLAAWSPDGLRMAVARDQKGKDEIGVANADGSGLAWLSELASKKEWISWSPDGTRLAFLSRRDLDRSEARLAREGLLGTYGDLFVMSTEGRSLVKVMESDGAYSDFGGKPAWSPDSRRLVFMRGSGERKGVVTNTDLYVANADGTGRAQLTSSSLEEAPATWSPDGKRMVFYGRNGAKDAKVYLMDADGGGLHQIAEVDWMACPPAPVWSPDGSRLALTVRDRWLIVMGADGSNLQRVAEVNGMENPAWSPDGMRIAFEGQGEKSDHAIYIVDADGKNLRKVAGGRSPGWMKRP